MVFTTRVAGGRARPQRPGGRAAPPPRRAEQQPPDQAHHLPARSNGSSRPPKAVARRPTPPATNLVQPRAAVGPVRGRLQPAAPPPVPARPGQARRWPTRPAPRPPPPHHATTTTASGTTASTRDGKVTLRVNGRLHHIGIGRTHARTPSCCWSTTSTSASSTRPPASCCASCSSTPPTTTSPSTHRAPRQHHPEPTLRVRGDAHLLRNHMVELRGFEPLTSCMPSRDPARRPAVTSRGRA